MFRGSVFRCSGVPGFIVCQLSISVLKNTLRVIHITIMLYFYVQIEICCNEIDDIIIHVYIQAKTDKAVK